LTRSIAALVLLLVLTAWVPARAQAPVVTLLQTHPSNPIGLGRDTTLMLRLAYESQHPVSIHATLVDADGRAVEINGGGAARPAGTGEAVVWVAAREARTVSRVEISVYDVDSARPTHRILLPLRASWRGEPASGPTPPQPAWIERIRAEQSAVLAERQAANPPPEDGIRGTLVLWSVPLYPIAQIIALVMTAGWWRVAAGLPLLVTGPLVAILVFCTIVGIDFGLLPLVLIFASPPAILYLVVLGIVRTGVAARA